MTGRRFFWSTVEDAGSVLDYTTFELIYSVSRRVNPSYSGALFRVRRDSDNTEQDIGYVSGDDMDAAALATFCSGTTGRIQKVYNQGTEGSDFDVIYVAGTRSIIYQSGAVEVVNGKPAMLGQATNDYRSIVLNIADSLFNNYKLMSSVISTQNGLSFGTIVGESASGATGNNRRGLISSTTTTQTMYEEIVTTLSISVAIPTVLQSTQNQQRQYSVYHGDPANFPVNSQLRGYYNGSLENVSNTSLGWGVNTTFRMQLMRYATFTFLGHFQEFSFKVGNGSNDESELRALETEQNNYYGVY